MPDLLEYCVNLRRVDMFKWNWNDEVIDVLAALGSRIRVLCIEN